MSGRGDAIVTLCVLSSLALAVLGVVLFYFGDSCALPWVSFSGALYLLLFAIYLEVYAHRG